MTAQKLDFNWKYGQQPKQKALLIVALLQYNVVAIVWRQTKRFPKPSQTTPSDNDVILLLTKAKRKGNEGLPLSSTFV